MKKIADFLLTIFSIGIVICLFAGGIAFIGYIFAFIIGGDIAPIICKFIYEFYFPWVIRFTSIFAGIGLIAMYFSKIKALTFYDSKNN